MKIVFLGDVVGRSGREAVARYLPDIKARFAPDVVIVNGENASHGFGISPKDVQFLYDAGADVITLGNHAFDRSDLITSIDRFPTLVRPLNWQSPVAGKGFVECRLKSGKKILVVNLLTQIFMQPADNPFNVLDQVLSKYRLGHNIDAIFVDFHGEASSEKLALAYNYDGRVSAVVGTHTHIPTADTRILPKGCAYQTDAGMCGDYQSVIGMEPQVSIARLRGVVPRPRLQPASGEGTASGLYIETDDSTGKAIKVEAIRVGGVLTSSHP